MVPEFSSLFTTTGEPVDRELDVRDLRCPMPLLKAKQVLHNMKPGESLRVLASDPASLRDFQLWSAQGGHTLLCTVGQNNVFIYVLRKCS